MSLKHNVLGPEQYLVLKYKGLFDFQKLYEAVATWFKSRSFEFHEYQLKHRTPDLPAEEGEYFWYGWRDDTDYMRIWLRLYLRLWNAFPVDVVKDGVKKQMQRGRLRVTIEAEIETDYESRWETSKFFETLRHFYEMYVYKKKIDMYGDKLEYEAHNLHEVFKTQLEMEGTGNQFADMW